MAVRISIFIIALLIQSCVFSNDQWIKNELILPEDDSMVDQIIISGKIMAYPVDICDIPGSCGYKSHIYNPDYIQNQLIELLDDKYYFEGIYYNNYFHFNLNNEICSRYIRFKSDVRDLYIIFRFDHKWGKWYLGNINFSVVPYNFR